MEITQEQKDGINVMKIDGRLDASTAADLENALGSYTDQEKVKILVDCEGLDYISSAGLRVLLASAKEFKKKEGKIVLSTLNPNVKQVFEISGFTSIFPIFETTDEAIAGLKG